MPSTKLVPAVVAKGRTVIVGAGTQTVGKGLHERKIVVPGHAVKPGERVELPEDEVADLMKHGFLVKPDGVIGDTMLISPKTMQENASAPDHPEA